MKNTNMKFTKLAFLSVLIMSSALAMDPVYVYPGIPARQTTPGAVPETAALDSQLRDAVLVGNKQLVETLIDGGAKINAPDENGRVVLTWAIFHGNYEICKLLIDKGAHVNAQDNDGDTALIKAAFEGRKEICKLLIAHGALVNVQDDLGSTALMLAALGRTVGPKDCKEICKLLLDNGAHVNVQDRDGETALMSASMRGYNGICNLLLAQGAAIHQEDKRGWTALMRAAAKDRKTTCQFLIKKMMKFTNDEIKSTVALLGSSKMRRSWHLNLVGRDVVSLIVCDLCNKIKAPKRAKAQEEIMKIKNCDRALREELLQYLNTL
jgi:hypothetical protein